MSQSDPTSLTLLLKKYRITVLLTLPPTETIANTQHALLNALKSREITDINGDSIPEDPSQIELGVAVDKNDLGKGWTVLEVSKDAATLQALSLRNGQPIAFRFRKAAEGEGGEDDLEHEDPGWDVVTPSLDDEEEEEN